MIILFLVGFVSGGVLGDVGESISSKFIPGGMGNFVKLVGTVTFLKSIFPISGTSALILTNCCSGGQD